MPVAGKNYRNDYRVVRRVGPGGRRFRDVEYIGEAYSYPQGPEETDRQRRGAVILCAAGAAVFIAALIPVSAASHTFWITFPFLFAAVPLGLIAEAVITAPKGGKTLERRQADKLAERYPAACVFLIGLCALSLVGEIVCAVRGGAEGTGDIVFSVCDAALCVCGVLLFHKRRSFDIRKAETVSSVTSAFK